jgi:hypothetical protein
MSLIKSVDVPKHMADRLRSRRLAARLSRGATKTPALSNPLPSTPIASPFASDDAPSNEIIASPSIL